MGNSDHGPTYTYTASRVDSQPDLEERRGSASKYALRQAHCGVCATLLPHTVCPLHSQDNHIYIAAFLSRTMEKEMNTHSNEHARLNIMHLNRSSWAPRS